MPESCFEWDPISVDLRNKQNIAYFVSMELRKDWLNIFIVQDFASTCKKMLESILHNLSRIGTNN